MQLQVGQHCCDVDFCRGMHGKCQFALVGQECMRKDLSVLFDRSIEQSAVDVPPHKRIKIAFAACPNACTLPQIKDIGIVAKLFPRAVLENCNHCGQCAAVCRESAIGLAGGLPQFDHVRCVGCGNCIGECPQQAIRPAPLQLAVLIGGRMGRHPRFADRMCVVNERNLAALVEKLLTAIDRHLNAHARFADMIEHAGLSHVKEQILHG